MLRYLLGTQQTSSPNVSYGNSYFNLPGNELDDTVTHIEEDAIVSWPVYEYAYSGTVHLLCK
jgi:hypothetical protein